MKNILSSFLELTSEIVVCLGPQGAIKYLSRPAQELLQTDPKIFQRLIDNFDKYLKNKSDVIELHTVKFKIQRIEADEPLLLFVGQNLSPNTLISASYLQQLVDYAPGSLYWKDKQGRYMGCNKTMVTTSRLSSVNEIIGKTDKELWPHQATSLSQNDEYVIKTGQTISSEEQVSVQGKLLHFIGIKAPLRNEAGEIIGMIGNSLEITELKETHANLAKAKILAEAASQAKSNFIANMSHDIRTPVTGILGLAQSLKEHSENETNRQDAQLLIGATEQLLTLLNEIIEVVRIESYQTTARKEDFDLIALIEHNIELLQPALRDKKLVFIYQIEPTVPRYLYGHRIYINRIFLNLLSNAIKFTEKGQISIIFSAQEIKDNKSKIILKMVIEDTGIGIPKDKFKAIFEYFSRLSSSHEGRYKGYGLGLYTIKQYLEVMRGKVTVASELGKGSCFTVTIPLKIGKEVTTQIIRVFEPMDLALKNIVPQTKVNARILLVEDEPLAALMAIRLFQERGCEITHVKDGATALNYAINEKFDLILMDLGLPDFSGIDLTRQIRKLSSLCNTVPIIALTGHMTSDKHKECLDAGMQEMLTKPLTITVLHKLLMTYLKK